MLILNYCKVESLVLHSCCTFVLLFCSQKPFVVWLINVGKHVC
jgi:hypothetical protein